MNRSKLFAAAIFASACVNTLEGPPFDELEGAGGSAGSAAGSSSTGAMGGAAPQGGAVSGGSTGSISGTSTLGGTGFVGGTGSGGTGVGGTGLGGASGGTLGGTSGSTLGGTSGTGAGGLGGTVVTGGAGGAGARMGGGTSGSGGALAGTGSGGAAGSTSPSNFPAVRDLIVEVCADATCHGGRERPTLTAATLHTTLTSTAVRQCGNDRLVTPGDTANSAILSLVNGQCGMLLMPESCMSAPCLGTGDQKIISDWILAGAPP